MQPTNEEITRIIDAARWAPSGDNCQPWSFTWDSLVLRVFYDYERGRHPLNPGESASMIALGCLLESIELAASAIGFECRTSLSSLAGAIGAQVEFTRSDRAADPLSNYLKTRATDRRLFQGGELTRAMLSPLEHDGQDVRIHVVNEIDDELMEFILACELILMNHDRILPTVLSWVRLSQREARETGDGISWRNMNARIWELPMIPTVRRFPSILTLVRPTMRRQHLKRVRKQLQSSAGLVCVSTSGGLDRLPSVGRLMMRAWLRLTQLGYGVQPLTLSSLLILLSQLNLLDNSFFAPEFYEKGHQTLARAFGVPVGFRPAWMIRTGIASPLPEALRTYRRPVTDLLNFPKAALRD